MFVYNFVSLFLSLFSQRTNCIFRAHVRVFALIWCKFCVLRHNADRCVLFSSPFFCYFSDSYNQFPLPPTRAFDIHPISHQVGFNSRPFYCGRPCKNRDSYAAITKTIDSVSLRRQAIILPACFIFLNKNLSRPTIKLHLKYRFSSGTKSWGGMNFSVLIRVTNLVTQSTF